MMEYLLLLETKSSQTLQADVIIASSTASGLQPLLWYNRVLGLLPPRSQPGDAIFLDDLDQPWTSHSFRTQYLYPCLQRLKAEGDPYLQALAILTAFWSLHSYRSGAQTHVD